MNTQRYQYGSLTRRKRIRTEDVWQFRYYETKACSHYLSASMMTAK